MDNAPGPRMPGVKHFALLRDFSSVGVTAPSCTTHYTRILITSGVHPFPTRRVSGFQFHPHPCFTRRSGLSPTYVTHYESGSNGTLVLVENIREAAVGTDQDPGEPLPPAGKNLSLFRKTRRGRARRVQMGSKNGLFID